MWSFKLVCEEVWTALGHEVGGRERWGAEGVARGGKVLELNYIVCVEETGADRQMAVDKCCKGNGAGWVGRRGCQCSPGTKSGVGGGRWYKESLYINVAI